MFVPLLLVSSIIAGVASPLTVVKMDHLISNLEDLASEKMPVFNTQQEAYRCLWFMMMGGLIEMQYYGITLLEGSVFREEINRVIPDILHSEAWKKIKYRYLGE